MFFLPHKGGPKIIKKTKFEYSCYDNIWMKTLPSAFLVQQKCIKLLISLLKNDRKQF